MPATNFALPAGSTVRKANYGVDAPDVVRRFILIGATGILVSAALIAGYGKWLPLWARYFLGPCLTIGCMFVAQAGVMIWGSKFGKIRLREKILDTIPWRGDEQVLDVGCGRGLMLIGAARR